MCFSSPPPPPPAPPPPAPMAPQPLATVAPADGNNRKDTSAMQANRGRSSLRIDRTQPNTGTAGNGLNIPS